MAKATEHNVQWKTVKFDHFFDMLPTNTLSRDKLNNQQGEYQNIHYGDVLIKYPFCLDCNNAEIPYINDGVKFNMAEIRDGDVIFADTAEDDTVGKCVEVLNVGDRKIVSGLHTYFCRPRHKMALGYLGYYLNSNHFHNQLLPYIAGSKVSSVNRTSIARTFIIYPESLPAQRRIAAILSSADKVIASTQKVIAKYKQMKQGMMEDLLKPKEGWKKVKLGEIGTFKNGINKDKSQFGFGTKYVSISDAYLEEINYKTLNRLNATDKEIEEYSLFTGDIVFVRSSVKPSGVGYTTLFGDYDKEPVLFSGFMIRYRLNDNINYCPSFLNYLLRDERFRLQVISKSTVSANTNINQESLKELSCSIPNIAEQRRIAAILSGIDAKIAAEEKVLEKYEKVKKGMMERMLTK